MERGMTYEQASWVHESVKAACSEGVPFGKAFSAALARVASWEDQQQDDGDISTPAAADSSLGRDRTVPR